MKTKTMVIYSLSLSFKNKVGYLLNIPPYFYRFSGIILPESYQYDFDGVPPQTVLRRTLSISCPPPQC